MILTIIIIYLALWLAFLWMVNKADEKFGWWCIGIMLVLIIYLPVTITINKISPSCLNTPEVSQINWEQKYNTLKSFLEDTGMASEEFLREN